LENDLIDNYLGSVCFSRRFPLQKCAYELKLDSLRCAAIRLTFASQWIHPQDVTFTDDITTSQPRFHKVSSSFRPNLQYKILVIRARVW